jgi:hypothetical protein
MKKLIILALCATTLLTSCYQDALETKTTDNQYFNVELLFTVDSCKVYRFEDGGRSHYVVTGPNARNTTSEQHQGKTTYDETNYTQQ